MYTNAMRIILYSPVVSCLYHVDVLLRAAGLQHHLLMDATSMDPKLARRGP